MKMRWVIGASPILHVINSLLLLTIAVIPISSAGLVTGKRRLKAVIAIYIYVFM